MITMTRKAATVLAVLACTATGLGAQGKAKADRAAYFRAVASFFRMPQNEISILGDWDLNPDDIPVAVFIARHAGVSPDAVVALRKAGRSWQELARRYGVTAATLHLPIPETASAGPLTKLYERYRSLPVARWREIDLSDQEIVILVNVRVVAQTLSLPPQQVLADASPGRSFVELYATLIRRSG